MLKVGDKIIIKSKSIGTKSDWLDSFDIDLSKIYIIHKVWKRYSEILGIWIPKKDVIDKGNDTLRNNNEYLFAYEIKINGISAFFLEKDLIKVDFLPDRLFEI